MKRRLLEPFLVFFGSVAMSLLLCYLLLLPMMQPKIAVVNVNALIDKHTMEFAAFGLDEQKNKQVASIFGKSIARSIDDLEEQGYTVFEKAAVVSEGALDITDQLYNSSSERIFEVVEFTNITKTRE